ncbi:MAG TPA: histidine kinase [Gemmatimonadaceae bacterium]|nr:histidine kinase [Gemmatimonadaceae bacterium]
MERVLTVPVQSDAGWMRRVFRRIFGVPLIAKLIGANVIIVASALLVHAIAFTGRRAELLTVIVALASALIANLILVRVALRPIEDLEDLALKVSKGEFDARGVPSLFADKDLARLRITINDLLDSLAAERKRIQDLGVEVVRAQDAERASFSRELHDSIAQTLAAVRFQLAAASRADETDDIRNRIAAANGMVSAAMEEIMSVSYSLHSRVAEDLGLDAALGTLARQVEDRSGASIDISVSPRSEMISSSDSAMLFKVAEEALRDVEVQSDAKTATVKVDTMGGITRLEIWHDGSAAQGIGERAGLASIKDRISLAGGTMKIENRNGGTRVIAELRTMKAAS